METETKTITIDPEGDVTLEISFDEKQPGGTYLLVSSKALSLASKVFARMFKSGFKEGLSNATTAGMVKVSLPEDNAEAMVILCRVIHWQVDEIPRRITPTCLESLVVICDKYDCAKALSPHGAIWLQAAFEYPTGSGDIEKYLFAAYVLDVPEMFSGITWEIIVDHTGPLLYLKGLNDHGLIPDNILGMSI